MLQRYMISRSRCLAARRSKNLCLFLSRRRYCTEGVAQSVKVETKRAPLSVGNLIKTYGLPLAIYYWVTNEILVCIITYLLHYGYFGGSDVMSLLKSLGLDNYCDFSKIEASSFEVGPVSISARLATNFALASAFMALWTPLQVPFCVVTLPRIKRIFGR